MIEPCVWALIYSYIAFTSHARSSAGYRDRKKDSTLTFFRGFAPSLFEGHDLGGCAPQLYEKDGAFMLAAYHAKIWFSPVAFRCNCEVGSRATIDVPVVLLQ